MVLLGVAEVVVVAGVVTDWFGFGPELSKGTAGGPSMPAGESPNPFGEKVDGLMATIDYAGNASGYFPAIDHVDLCRHCPALPAIDWGRAPPRAVVTVLFNVTNTGSSFHEITSFALSAAGAKGPHVFTLFGVYCCAPNNYGEDVDFVGLTPGQTMGLEAYLTATAIPSAGGVGYELTLAMVSSN